MTGKAPSPVFVFGVARGGTNLIARMLDAHPQVSIALDPLMPLFKLWRNLILAERQAWGAPPLDPASPFQDDQFDTRAPAWAEAIRQGGECPLEPGQLVAIREALVERAGLEAPVFAEQLRDIGGDGVSAVLRGLLRAVAAWGTAAGKSDLRWVGTKEVWTADFIPALHRLYPDARFVIAMRDPRAVLVSLIGMGARDESQKAHGVSYLRHWRKLAYLSRRFGSDPVLEKAVLTVRFEDVCARPEDGAAQLARHLGLETDAAMLTPGGEEGWTGNSSFGENGAPVDAASVDRWRRRIEPAHQALVEFMCGPDMRLMGYEPDADRPVLTQEMVEATLAFDRDPGKWRSDSGDVWQDLAWESLRARLACLPGHGDVTIKERCLVG